ncbi:MAG TPA: hypothetical protein GX745_01135 [Clostridiales bacterium]|jgi:hypothetical protein|nr:hypothetical protein [Clostridiales bacterium]
MRGKKEKGELRKLAAGAKARLKSGYWTAVKQERELARQKALEEGKPSQLIDEFYKNKHTREIKATINSVNNSDEILYKKVCEILDKNEDIINPVKSLIDQEKYEKMDFVSRQRYLLMLMSKYSELKERYYKEKQFLKNC